MRILIIAALAAGIVGCSSDGAEDEQPWRFGENNSGENNTSNHPNNTEPNNDLEPSPNNEQNNAEPPSCVDFDIDTFDAQPGDFAAYPLVDDGLVYLSQYAPGSGVMFIVQWDGEALIPVLIENVQESTAIAAEDGYLWFSADGRLARYQTQTEETEFFDDIPVEPSFGDVDYWAQPRQTATAQSLTFTRGGEGFLTTDGAVEPLGPIWWGSAAWLGPRGVSWVFLTDSTGANLRHVGDGLDIAVQDIGGTFSSPVSTDERLFYVHDGRVMALDLDDDAEPADVEIDAACGPLHTDGETIVTACNPNWFDGPTPSPPPTDYLSLAAQEIWVIDSGTLETERVFAADDRTVHFPMLNERWIAWVEFTPDVSAQAEPGGQIRVLPRGGSAAVDIAEMGYGCPYCGAYWPAARLVLDDDTLAWNYAIDDERNYRNRVGVAQLRCP